MGNSDWKKQSHRFLEWLEYLWILKWASGCVLLQYWKPWMLFLDHENWFSAIIDMAFVNNLTAYHFLVCFHNLRALRTESALPILHIVCISRRGMKTCTSKKPDLSFPSSPRKRKRAFSIIVWNLFSGLPLFRKFAENCIFGLCGKFRKCKFSQWEDSRKSPIPTNRINIAGSRFTGRHLAGMSRLSRFHARAQLSEIRRSSLSPCPQSALVAET